MTNSGAQRAELHKAIWNIANVLRGSVDGWDFKQYVLGFLFYRFISEDITSYLNGYEHQAGDVDFDYAKLDDATAEQVRKSMVEEKGYFILPSDLFANVRRCADADENLNETLQRVFKNIEGSAIGSRSESSLRGLFDDLDLNSRKLGDTVVERNAKLVKVLNAIGNLDLGTESFADNTIDAFGDAYEYLMTMYAANAGKSGGEFFTPQEVSELLTRIATHGKSEVNKVYDPACGSGSLLLQSIKVLGKDKVRQGFFGQEKNLTTYNLCRINMFLHDVNYDHFNIAYGDTLINPQHWDDEPFEVVNITTRPTPPSGRVMTTPRSWTIHDFLRLACLRRSRRPIWRSPCTCSPGWRPTAPRPSSSFPACSIAVARSRRSANICWRATSSTR